MPIERTNLWMDVFARDLEAPAVPERRGAEARAARVSPAGASSGNSVRTGGRSIQALRDDIAAMQKAMPEPYPYVHGVRDIEKPENLKVAIRGSAYRLGPGSAARLSDRARRRRPADVHARAAAGSNWPTTIAREPDHRARHRQSPLEEAISAPAWWIRRATSA